MVFVASNFFFGQGTKPISSRRFRLLVVGLLLMVGMVFLASYLWRGRLPYDVHPTDGEWLPEKGSVQTTGLLAHPNSSDYEVQPYLDEPPRKILLVTIDTLRADHLSSYGYVKETTPFLDRLADRGLTFTRAYAPTSTTLPSHAALMTGLYPLQLNVLTNYEKVGERFTTLAELLKRADYNTAGFVSTNRHFRPGNLDQGFQHFDEPTKQEQAFRPPGSDTRFNLFYRPAERTLNRARSWLKARPDGEKQFVWIHLFDPHFPYAYRPNYHDPLRYEDRTRRSEWIQSIRKGRGVDLRDDFPVDAPDENPYISAYRLYDGEIRYVDEQLRSFYTFLDRTWKQDPFTIVTSDHGEGMGNHDWWGHSKYVYNEQVRVPLIIHHPELRSDGEIERIVELNDLYTTIGRESRVSFEAVNDTVPPNSFPLQLLREPAESEPFGMAFASRKRFKNDKLGAWNWMLWRWRQLTTGTLKNPLDPGRRWNQITWPGQQHALVNDTRSYVYNTALRDGYYDQVTDFYQETNRIAEGGSDWRRPASTIGRILKELKERQAPDPGIVDPATRKKLRGLGYVN